MTEIMREQDKTIAKFDQDLVASVVPELKQELQGIVEQGEDLAVDLQAVNIVDSKGIGLLIATHNSLQENNKVLEVMNPSEDVLNLFKSMRLDKHFRIS
ncbi:MAG: STAS domain-containing protein [Thermodesulfobacteriota bacterium]